MLRVCAVSISLGEPVYCSTGICTPPKTHVYWANIAFCINSQGLNMHRYDLLDESQKRADQMVLYRQLSKWIRFVAAVYATATGVRLYGLNGMWWPLKDQCPPACERLYLSVINDHCGVLTSLLLLCLSMPITYEVKSFLFLRWLGQKLVVFWVPSHVCLIFTQNLIE